MSEISDTNKGLANTNNELAETNRLIVDKMKQFYKEFILFLYHSVLFFDIIFDEKIY